MSVSFVGADENSRGKCDIYSELMKIAGGSVTYIPSKRVFELKRSLVGLAVQCRHRSEEGIYETRHEVFTGLLLFLTDLVTLFAGVLLLYSGTVFLGSISGGKATELIVEQIGRKVSIDLNAVGFLVVLAGLALVLAATGYALNALKDAKASEGGAKDTFRYFSPL
jgi:hypothetical protein